MKRFAFLVIFFHLLSFELTALPKYSFRSARICDNCHSTPFANRYQKEWKNPELKKRKCNLSCQSCHVNPAGGGMRNAPGRYYAASTLPIGGARKRGYHDRFLKRNLPAFMREQNRRSRLSPEQKKLEAEKARAAAQQKQVKAARPSAEEIAAYYKQFEPKFYYSQDFLSFGYPLNATTMASQSEYAFDRDRYGSINADPFLSLGLNARLAYFAGDVSALFPMQFDTGVSIHPVEHLTLSGTTGVQGRTSGFSETIESKNRFKIQNAFALIHELPYQAYLQGGVFLPEFGLRVEDHTAYGRRHFEMDTVFTNQNARGVQIGFAPNYPYASAAVFETVTQNGKKTGTGLTANLAYRGIVAGIGASYLQKNRYYNDGGNLYAISLNGYYNLWGLFNSMRYTNPILIQFEYNLGQKPRTATSEKLFATWMIVLDYLIFNGVNLRLGQMFYDADFEIKNDTEARPFFGFDLAFYRGWRLTFDYRLTLPEGGESSGEMIIFLHGFL